ncbi:hypothetical protein ACFYRJ_38430 [Streptomyces sp. NPDC005531]|uniref:hypothetical protein n=1 Tax=Streptomyces sp. NPDC005531 TaxID=3364722 RepID=UPI0036CD8D42
MEAAFVRPDGVSEVDQLPDVIVIRESRGSLTLSVISPMFACRAKRLMLSTVAMGSSVGVLMAVRR